LGLVEGTYIVHRKSCPCDREPFRNTVLLPFNQSDRLAFWICSLKRIPRLYVLHATKPELALNFPLYVFIYLSFVNILFYMDR
jgi:hypothetical protein